MSTGRLSLAALLGVCACASAATTGPVESSRTEVVSRPAATPNVLRGERLLVEGRVDEARRIFEQAIADDPDDARAWLDLGLAYEAREDMESARAAYRRATEIDPRFAEAFNNLGVLLREAGQLADATGALERAVALDPDLSAARFNLGLAYEDRGKLDDAEREYLAAIRQLPRDPVPKINLAMMYLSMGRTRDAAAQLRGARPLVRDDVLLSIAVGEGLRRAEAPREAIDVLQSALDRSGDRPPTELLAELALAHYAAGDFSSAEQTMRRAVLQDELDPALQYAYGSILVKLGQVGRAKVHLKRALKLDPDGPYADRARGRLEALK